MNPGRPFLFAPDAELQHNLIFASGYIPAKSTNPEINS
jgi:hypothetical protein